MLHYSSTCLKGCTSSLRYGSLSPRPKPTPARITSSDTGSDPRWRWFGSGAETRDMGVLQQLCTSPVSQFMSVACNSDCNGNNNIFIVFPPIYY